MDNFILPIFALLSILFVIFYAGYTIGYHKAVKKILESEEKCVNTNEVRAIFSESEVKNENN